MNTPYFEQNGRGTYQITEDAEKDAERDAVKRWGDFARKPALPNIFVPRRAALRHHKPRSGPDHSHAAAVNEYGVSVSQTGQQGSNDERSDSAANASARDSDSRS
jgi:hypothetical protein